MVFDVIKMLRFCKTKAAKENIWEKICDVYVANIVASKLNETKNNSKYLIGYLDDVIRPLILI